MYGIKGWMRFLKAFEPRVIALAQEETVIKSVVPLSQNTYLKKGIIYIGDLTEGLYRFRASEMAIFFLVKDTDYRLEDINCGHNTVILFPPETDRDELFSRCTEYLQVQGIVIEKTQRLMDIYFADLPLHDTLDGISGIIGNPLMLLDNSYRIVGASDIQKCDDLLWMESIKDGFCSYEFVSQFNKLTEIETIRKGESPVLAGCFMSPMRRCIIKMTSGKRPIGYLLSIESETVFDESITDLLETAARLLSKAMAYDALSSGKDLYHSTWNAVVNAIERVPNSDRILAEYLLSEGIRTQSVYYILLCRMGGITVNDDQSIPFFQLFRSLFPRSVFSYYQHDAVIIVEYTDGEHALKHLFEEKLTELVQKDVRVAISDSFEDLSQIRRYYRQAKKTQHFMKLRDPGKRICFYDEIRMYDLLSDDLKEPGIPLFLRKEEIALYEYDRENGTEYFRTLCSYICHSRRLQDVADEMHIHKNTVSYRINRVRELFDLDLNDALSRMRIYLAYHALEIGSPEEGE